MILRSIGEEELNDRRVGENEPIRVDCRIICATHRPLEEMILEGAFREDLFFRINTFEIRLPPLRERLEDLPDLVEHLVRRLRPQIPDGAEVVTKELLATLARYPWRGNVRELANVVEYALVVSDTLPLGCDHLPERIARQPAVSPMAQAAAPGAAQPIRLPAAILPGETGVAGGSGQARLVQRGNLPSVPTEENSRPPDTGRPLSLRELEMQAILDGLDRNEGNKARTAEELGISIKTLYNKLNQYAEGAGDRAAS